MADNITVKDSSGAVVTLATSEAGGVHTPKHILAAGAAHVGSVAIDAAIPPGSNAIGSVALQAGQTLRAYLDGGSVGAGAAPYLVLDGTAYQIKRQLFDTLVVADPIIGPVTGKKFRILALWLKFTVADPTPGGLAALSWQDGAAAPVLPPIYLQSHVEDFDLVLPFNPAGWGETLTANSKLALVLPSFGSARAATGSILYIEF